MSRLSPDMRDELRQGHFLTRKALDAVTLRVALAAYVAINFKECRFARQPDGCYLQFQEYQG